MARPFVKTSPLAALCVIIIAVIECRDKKLRCVIDFVTLQKVNH